jgi:hypothetical protein
MRQKKLPKRLLAMLLTLIMLLGVLPPAAALEDEDEPAASTVQVSFSAQAAGAFLCGLQQDVAVSSDLAESYGYTDYVTDGVSALDVLVKAHQVVFGDAFTKDDAATMLNVDGTMIKTMFGVETSNVGFTINGESPHGDQLSSGYYNGYAVNQAEVSNDDQLEFFIYQDNYALDNYAWFVRRNKPLDSLKIVQDVEVSLNLKGYCIGWYGLTDQDTIDSKTNVIDGAQLCLINAATGACTDMEGVVTDEDGAFKIKISTPGEYYLSAYIPASDITDGVTPLIMPVLPVTVIAPPTLTALSIKNTKDDTIEYPLSETFDPEKRDGYSITVPDYVSNVKVYATKDDSLTDFSLMYTSKWGYSSNSAAAFPKSFFEILFYDSGYSKCGGYQVDVNQYATLTDLTVNGVMSPDFEKETKTYHAYVDANASSVEITATPYSSAYTITIGGQTATDGKVDLTYDWDGGTTMEVPVVVSADDKVSNTYTLTLGQEPQNDQPFIVTQPTGADYIQGDEATALAVHASANGTLGYQWYRSDVESGANGTPIADATTASYTPSTAEIGTAYYSCVITNQDKTTNNTITTDVVSVTVDPDPTPEVTLLTTGANLPTDDGYSYGDTVGYDYDYNAEATPLKISYSSAAEGGIWSFKWWRATKMPATAYGSVSGETSDTFTPGTTVLNNTGYWYKCAAYYTFKGNVYRTDSDWVYVFVKATEAQAPVFKTQPISGEYFVGEDPIALAVANKSISGTVTYQWYQSTVDSKDDATAIDGATAKTYTPIALTEPGTIYYYCKATNTLQKYTAATDSDLVAITYQSISDVVGNTWKGQGTETSPYLLTNETDLDHLAEFVAEGAAFSNCYFQITQDITLSSSWESIGTLKNGATATSNGINILPFSGVLDGGNHTLTFAEGSAPLFKYVREAAVKDFAISAPYMASYALVSDYTVDYGSDGNYNAGSGGSVSAGCPDTIDVTNVTIKSGSVIKYGGFLGGYASGGNVCNFANCTVESGVKIGWDKNANASSGSTSVGSFGGSFNGTMINCVSYADVYGVNYVGGIVGHKGQSMGPYSIKNCAFLGTVNATGTYVGGIAGGGYTSSSAPNTPCATIQNCYCAGSVSGEDYVGGILGAEAASVQNWAEAYLTDNHFAGTLTATGGNVGGIIGYMNSLDRYNVISNNYFVDTCGAANGIGEVNLTNLDLTSTDYGRDDDPLNADADKLSKAMTATEFADGTVKDLLNQSETSFQNWTQDTDYPVFSAEPVAYKLVISGDYQTQYYLGDDLDLDGMTFTADWSDGTTTHPTLEDVTVTGYDNETRGVQTITVTFGAAKAGFTVTVLKRSQEGESDTITVYFTLLGDDAHGDSTAVHTLKYGNLQTWIRKKAYTVDLNATVRTVFEKALTEAGLTWRNPTGNYVEAITRNGTELAEYTNGDLSGWMYTLNGTHPDLGLNEQYLDDGDAIVWHYTDDYTVEEGSETWNTPTGGSTGTSSGQSEIVKPNVSVSGSTVNASVGKSALADAVTAANKNQADTITVSAETDQSVTSSKVTLNATGVQGIGEKTQANLMISTPNGAVSIPNGALGTLASSGRDIVVTVTEKDLADLEVSGVDTTNALAVEVNIDVGDKAVTTFDGKSLTINLPVNNAYAEGGRYKVVIISSDGTAETVSGQCIKEDGKLFVQVSTVHLSTFVVTNQKSMNFSDVTAGDWYYDAVQYTCERDFFHGTSETAFSPDVSMTRAMMVTVLYRMEGSPSVTGTNAFTDVASGQYYTDAVLWAGQNQIANGISATLFHPDDLITREQMATILYRYAVYKKCDTSPTTDLAVFTDAALVDSFAEEAMQWAIGSEIISGTTKTTLAPVQTATRAQVATILMRFCENTAN